MGETPEQIIEQLEQEYVPLDSSLIRAIILDYDLTKTSDLTVVREQLDMLRASAVAEEDTAFDASGTNGAREQLAHGSSNSVSEAENNSIVTGTTLLSLDSTSGSSSPPESSSSTLAEYSHLNADAKLKLLKELFPTLRPRDVELALRKSGEDVGRATDVLLNQVFFEDGLVNGNSEEAIHVRGVDAFSEDHNYTAKRGKTRKNKKKFRSLDDEYDRSSSTSGSTTPSNKWTTANEDIAFISSRTQMSTTYISSLYHQNGASRRQTIKALIEEHLRTEKQEYDVQVAAYASDLVEEFPSLSHANCAALIRLTKQSTANAHELAKVLAYAEDKHSGAGALIPQYAPIKLPETSSTTKPALPSTAASVSGSAQLDSRTILAARSAAFENASKYYRRGKSDKLMGGATAYYSSLGRDLSTSLATASAAEADALVASQSTTTTIDLHGVTVREAVRIACARTSGWWDGLGEQRIPGGGRNHGGGLKIVTGLGRHSEGGRAKLGPAVSKALLSEGWKVEVGSGELIVKGRMR